VSVGLRDEERFKYRRREHPEKQGTNKKRTAYDMMVVRDD
jgi:hypothetical protein